MQYQPIFPLYTEIVPLFPSTNSASREIQVTGKMTFGTAETQWQATAYLLEIFGRTWTIRKDLSKTFT